VKKTLTVLISFSSNVTVNSNWFYTIYSYRMAQKKKKRAPLPFFKKKETKPNQTRTLASTKKKLHYIVNAFFAISKAPSYVSFPPINPDACTNTPPGTPLRSDNSASLNPLQGTGSAFLESKLPGAVPTA
jgi:hypothetical protein